MNLATDGEGNELELVQGGVLPDWAGSLAGSPGHVYAKVLRDLWSGEEPTGAYWRPVRVVRDTRIPAMSSHAATYQFATAGGSPVFVKATLILRRAFEPLAKKKGWNDPDLVMHVKEIEVPVQIRRDGRIPG